MNILHMKYAVAVADAGSISKASELALVAQPNLSRSIKELEADLGITIFARTTKGMCLTPEGEEFIGYAKKLLKQFDELESYYKTGVPARQSFSLSCPRASYISYAFSSFANHLSCDPAEIFYNETSTHNVINNILRADYKMGIIRYAEEHDKYYKSVLQEKGISSELVAEFKYVLLVHRESPLAKIKSLSRADLKSYIEVCHTDSQGPSLPSAELKKEELSGDIDRRIFVFERASQYDLLSRNHNTFMWVSPMPSELLDKYGFVTIPCEGSGRLYRDVLIYRSDYHLSDLDHQFITELCKAKRACIS